MADEIEEQGADTPAQKQRRSYASRANADLRAARRSHQAQNADPSSGLKYLLAEAEVLAMLDLADALRGDGEPE
jgi:hypothetical protein